jgi:hypothetical protein
MTIGAATIDAINLSHVDLEILFHIHSHNHNQPANMNNCIIEIENHQIVNLESNIHHSIFCGIKTFI